MLSVLDYKVIAKPNSSLSLEGVLKVLAAMTLVALVVALGFVKMGAWLVLPFAGLELLGFALAFYYVRLHADDFESITIGPDEVVVEKSSRRVKAKSVFQRYWTRVRLEELSYGKSALYIGSHDDEVEFGQSLIDEEQRLVLLKELKQKLKYN